MGPKILAEGSLIFWFRSYDALRENRASVHVGKGVQNDHSDAKIWLEPNVGIARSGRTLREHELNRAFSIVEQNLAYLLEEWYDFKGRTD